MARRKRADAIKVYWLVRMVQVRREWRQKPQSEMQARLLGYDIRALVWALEQLGVAPDQYDEVVTEYDVRQERRRKRKHRAAEREAVETGESGAVAESRLPADKAERWRRARKE